MAPVEGPVQPGSPLASEAGGRVARSFSQKVFVVHGVITVGALMVSSLMKQMNTVWGEEMW